MSRELRAPSAPRPSHPTSPDANPHPWRVVLLLAVALFILVLVVGVALSSTKYGPEILGEIYAAVLPGCVAVGIWARRARRRWSVTEWAVRIALCLVASGLVMGALALASAVGTVTR